MTTQFGKAIVSIDAGYNKMTEKNSEYIRDLERTYLESGRTQKSHSEGSNPGDVFYTDLSASYDVDTLNLLSASFGGRHHRPSHPHRNTHSQTDRN